MKKRSLMLTFLLLLSGLSMLTFSSCDKDTNSYLTITVRDGETKKPISGVSVTVAPDGGDIEEHIGLTDTGGVYSTQFVAPAIMSIIARLDIPEQSTENTLAFRYAESSARLKEGETVDVKVILPTDVVFEPIH